MPLVGQCDTVEETALDWPAGKFNPERLRKPIENRLSKAFDAVKDDAELKFWSRLWLGIGWFFAKDKLADKIMAELKKALAAQKL